jgi:hypothetical protein
MCCHRQMLLLAGGKKHASNTDLDPLLWKRKTLGYTVSQGGQGSCKKSKGPIRRSLNEKRCGLPRLVASLLHK